jgi:PilZ domain
VESRRQETRLTINKEFDSFDQFVREYVTNISRSGVFIKTATPLAVGSLVDLKFSVVMDGIETIEGEGEVVRVEDNPSGMGVVFRKLGNYSQRLVERLLTQHSEG